MSSSLAPEQSAVTGAVKVPALNKMSIKKSLKPIWNLTFYGGIIPDWCGMAAGRRKWCIRFNLVGCCLCLSLSILMVAYQLTQLIQQSNRSTTIHAILPNVVCFCMYSSSITSLLRLLLFRRSFISFFDDWQALERQPCFVEYGGSRRQIHALIILYALMAVGTLTVMGILMWIQPDSTFFLTYYTRLFHISSFPFLTGVHLLTNFYTCTVVSMADIVPTVTYFHAAHFISALDVEVRRVLQSTSQRRLLRSASAIDDMEPQFNALWARYEQVRETVGRANQLFGFMMLIGHSLKFFMICSLAHSILYYYHSSDNLTLAMFSLNMIFFVLRLIVCVSTAAGLQRASLQLRAHLASSFSRHWPSLTKPEKHVLQMFLTRLQSNALSAAAWEMYTVDGTFLLRLLSLTVTYIVILLQFQ